MSDEQELQLPLQVKLAGFNVDKEGLDELGEVLKSKVYAPIKGWVQEGNPLMYADEQKLFEAVKETLAIHGALTPETLSASYARISRDPRDIPELRSDARSDVDGSRKSNKAIIFTMGHKSIAEHAVFNFDLMGLSRRAVEDVEAKRLQSYTEKSQRYITLDGDFVLPPEIKGTPFEQPFLDLVERQNAFYTKHLDQLVDWHSAQDYNDLFASLNYSTKPDKQRGTVEGLGKEDARYALAMATQAQLGLTTSARNLEDLITRLRSSTLAETRAIGEALYAEVDGVAPSVIKYTKPTDYFVKTRPEMQELVAELAEKYVVGERKSSFGELGDVTLYTQLSRDDSIIAGLLFSSYPMDYGNALGMVHMMSEPDKIRLLQASDAYQERHDPKLREYELGDRVADMEMSASAFAQIKRHRMDTLIPQAYDVDLGATVPASIIQMGLDQELLDIVNASSKLYTSMVNAGLPNEVAEYALTNAHRRRVLFDANNRQAHAFCAERENLAAQWDIRQIAGDYHQLIQEESPLTTRSLGGKHAFYDIKERMQLENTGDY